METKQTHYYYACMLFLSNISYVLVGFATCSRLVDVCLFLKELSDNMLLGGIVESLTEVGHVD